MKLENLQLFLSPNNDKILINSPLPRSYQAASQLLKAIWISVYGSLISQKNWKMPDQISF